MKRFLLLQSLVWLLVQVNVKAQHNHFGHFSLNEELPGSHVYKVFEDSKGYFWILTNNGISRYDGERLIQFNKKDGYDDAGAYQILEDKSGKIWILSTNFTLYSFTGEHFEKYKVNEALGWIFFDKDNKLWALKRSFGMKNPIFNVSAGKSEEGFSLIHVTYDGIMLGKDSFLLSSTEGIVFMVKGKKPVLILHSKTYHDFIVSRIFTLSDTVYLTNYKGIFKFNKKTLKTELVHAFANNEVFNIYHDSTTNNFLVGTKNGLFRFSGDWRKKEILLANEYIFSVIKSRDQVYWVTSATNGVYTCNFRSRHITQQEGLGGKRIKFIRRDKNYSYIIDEEDVYVFEKGKAERLQTPGKTGKLRFKKVSQDVFLIGDSLVVCGPVNYFVRNRKVLKESNVFRYYSTYNDVVFYNSAKGSFNAGNIQIVNLFSGIVSLRKAMKAAGIYTERWNPVYKDADTLYFVVQKGLLKVYWKKERPVLKLIEMNNQISFMIRYQDAFIVSTSTKGIYILRNGTIKNYNSSNGLLSDFCHKIVIHRNKIWVCTNKGLARINSLEPFNATNFTPRDYLINNEVNDLMIYQDTVYAATSRGVSIFYSGEEFYSYTPRIYLEKFSVNNKDTFIKEKFVTAYNANNFTFRFSSPGYRSGKANTYRFVVSDGDGADTSYFNNSTIQLSSLRSGVYDIWVSIKNIDGTWSEQPNHYQLFIMLPWWRTGLFYFVISGLLVLIVSVFAFLNIKRFKAEQVYKRKLSESELRSLRLYMNPHFIFNSLTTLQSFVLTGRNDSATQFLTGFSKLLRAVMGYSVKGELTLHEEMTMLANYLQLEKMRFKGKFNYFVSCDGRLDAGQIIIPSLIIQPFVENAAKHAFPDGEANNGSIDVYFYMEEGELWCKVEDNGVGRKSTGESSKLGDHISTGMRFTEERIRLILNNPWKQVVKVEDKLINNNPQGTSVRILIPLLNKK